jgi:hypothetical protein
MATCTNSLDCPTNQVCDQGRRRCVECVGSSDCPSGAVCAAFSCRTVCTSDKECTAKRQLCDKTAGHCVGCLLDGDCGASAHCESGACVANVCAPLGKRCLDAQILTCDARGTGYSALTCPETCSESGGAHCASGADAGGGGGGGGGSGAGGAGGSCGGAGGTSGRRETITVPACGNTPGTTSNAYGGLVTLTVSGVLVNSPPGALQDGFYSVNGADPSMSSGACPDCLRYNRLSEGTCLCSFECPSTSHRVADLLLDPYPPFDSAHVYTVRLDLGPAAPEPLSFGMADCGCFDNSGQYTVTIEPIATGPCAR